MYKTYFLALFMFLVCFLNGFTPINGEMLYEYDSFENTVFAYNNRLYVQSYYKLEEFQILPNGQLERISFIETKQQEQGHFDNRRFYSFRIIYPHLEITVYDLLQTPMVKLTEFVVNNIRYERNGVIFNKNHILISDTQNNRIVLINKETYKIDGYIEDFSSANITKSPVAEISDFSPVTPISDFSPVSDIHKLATASTIHPTYDSTELTINFYNIDSNNDIFGISEIMINKDYRLQVNYIEFQNSHLIVSHTQGVFVIEMMVANGVREDVANGVRRYGTPSVRTNLKHDLFIEKNINYSIYTQNTFFLAGDKTGLYVYQTDGAENYTLRYEDDRGNNYYNKRKNIFLSYPYLYMNKGTNLEVYDISDNFNIVFEYGFFWAYSDLNIDQQNLYFFEADIYNSIDDNIQYNIYDVYDNSLICSFYHKPMDVFWVSFFIYNNHLIISKNVTGIYVHEVLIYKIDNKETEFIKKIEITEPGVDFVFSSFINNNRFFFQYELTYLHNSRIDIYDFVNNDLIFLGSIPGRYQIISNSSFNTDYLIVIDKNSIATIRNINNFDEILVQTTFPPNFEIFGHYHIKENYFGLFFRNESDIQYYFNVYKYDINEESITLFSQNILRGYPALDVSDEIIIIHDNRDSLTEFFCIHNEQFLKIGEMPDTRQVSSSHFNSEKKKMVRSTRSGIWSYDILNPWSDIDKTLTYSISDKLLGNYPNPFNPVTTITFFTTKPSNVIIEIFNIKGQKVKTLIDTYMSEGKHSVTWNGVDDNDKSLASGVYFYQLKTDETIDVKRMVLLK